MPHVQGDRPDLQKYVPTPAEIQAECLKIQAGWSDWQRRHHTVQKVPPVTLPLVKVLGPWEQQFCDDEQLDTERSAKTC